MSSSLFSPSPLLPYPPPLRTHHHRLPRSRPQTLTLTRLSLSSPIRSSLSDPFVLQIAENLEDSHLSGTTAAPPSPLQKLRDSSSESLLSKPWPSNKLEAFRFTDTSFLRRSQIVPAPVPPSAPPFPADPPPSANSVVIIDGYFSASLSSLSSLSDGVYVGNLSSMPRGSEFERVQEELQSGCGFGDKDVFWDLNGVGAPDVIVLYVPERVRIVDEPLYVRFCSSEGTEVGADSLTVSNPRVIVVVEKGSEVSIIEEHFGVGNGAGRSYWANSVFEVVVGESAKVSHSYVQRQSHNAAHIKWTFAKQEPYSTYELVEISTGARLSRHNLHIQQLGSDTSTDLSTFHISRSKQIQDLHSSLILDHPRGYSRQIHKCIVADASGHAVFDGNIKVNRYAQQTDAGQLTRSLLLVPRATVNVKPNLQIIADDVKCSHGAAISDLEDEQLFYFQTRGVDLETARDALIFSFGAELVARLPFEPLRKSVASYIKSLLAAKDSAEY